MKTKRLLLTLSFTLCALASCQDNHPKEAAKQILRLNLYDDPLSLDPRTVRTIKDITLTKQLFDGLMRLDEKGAPQLAVAKEVRVSEDLLTYTFSLRDTVWNNYEPVTAHHFEYAWKKVLDPRFASDYAYMLYPIKRAQMARQGKCSIEEIGVKALDDQTLQVELHSPTPYFLELLAFPTYFPVHPQMDLEEKRWASGASLISNGPFCLNRWSVQSELVFQKNPLYWDSKDVALNQIVFSVIPDNATEGFLFDKKELDWLGQPISNNIASEVLEKLKQQGSLDSYPVAGTLWFEYNVEKEPFDNPHIRKAFAYAINRKDIIEHVLQGHQQAATGPLPPSMALRSDPYFADGDKSQACGYLEQGLAEKGWNLATMPKITLTFHPSERNNKLVQTIQQQWKETLGIEVELLAQESHLYRRTLRQGNFQIGIGEWVADFNDPLAFLEIFKYKNDSATGSGMHNTNWESGAFIELLDRSLTESNPKERKGLLQTAELILMQDMPIAPIYHYAFDYVKKPHVHNVVLSPLGPADFKWTHITEEQR